MRGSLFGHWRETARRSPRSVAVVEAASGRAFSRQALDGLAQAWAEAALRRCGNSLARRRIAFSVPNGAEWLQVFLGLLANDAVPVPIDPLEPLDAQQAAARSVGAAWLWREGCLHFLGEGSNGPARPAGECLVKMTSPGSGAPKGLPASHAQMAADGSQICRAMGIGPGDINLAAIPLGYSYGLGNLVVPLILQGTRVVCLSGVLPHAVAAETARFKPTVFPAVPPLLRALVESGVTRRSFRTLRLVLSAGSALSPEVAQGFEEKFGIRVHGFYGTSETGGITFDRRGDATLAGRSVGKPISGVRLKVGRSGRFTVSIPAGLGKGPGRPRDRGRRNEKGELVLLGRTDRVIKAAGRRFDLAEVESALRAIPEISDAFVAMSVEAKPALCAAVVSSLEPSAIRRLLVLRVAAWKIPSRILALPRFPVTGRGKTDPRKLAQLLAEPRTTASISTLSSERQISASR